MVERKVKVGKMKPSTFRKNKKRYPQLKNSIKVFIIKRIINESGADFINFYTEVYPVAFRTFTQADKFLLSSKAGSEGWEYDSEVDIKEIFIPKVFFRSLIKENEKLKNDLQMAKDAIFKFKKGESK